MNKTVDTNIGVLHYVVEEIPWELFNAKPGDVGFDIPVVVKAKNKKNKPRLKPHRDCWVHEDGTKDDPVPFVDIPPGGSAELATGIRLKLPDDAWVNIKPRSSTAWKKRLEVCEAVIDSGYTGRLFVLVRNPNQDPIRVHEGDRLAQIILIPKYSLNQLKKVEILPETERGSTGFGSSGGHTKL